MEGTSPTSDPNNDHASRDTNGRVDDRVKDEPLADPNAGSSSAHMPAPPPAAAAAVHQPKVVQTAFIHKLYK
jgi:hypothetical protein